MKTDQPVVVVGSGAFGTALAAVIAQAGKVPVTLLGRRQEVVDSIVRSRRNDAVLAGIDLPETLAVSADASVLRSADIVLFAMPSQAQVEAAQSLSTHLAADATIVICAKGMEKTSGRLLTDVLSDELPGHAIAVLSGPGFAADIARGLPTAMVVAAEDVDHAADLAEIISGRTFRLYPSSDRVGVQLGGALKNVLAIACGIVEGAGLGESARAALISRGLAELSRFVSSHGGQAETVSGLSGLGDLVLTATSRQSRNLRFGIAIGQNGMTPAQPGDLVEGAFAAGVAARIATERHIDMPITQAVAAIIEGRLDVPAALAGLMSRPITQE